MPATVGMAVCRGGGAGGRTRGMLLCTHHLWSRSRTWDPEGIWPLYRRRIYIKV